MKKITKILAITGGICAGAGVVFLTAGFFVGGGNINLSDAMSVRGQDLQKVASTLVAGDYSEGWDEDIENLDLTKWDCISAVGVKNLNIDMAAGYLDIRQYDGKDIKVYKQKNAGRIEIEQDGETLDIEQDGESLFNKRGEAVKVLVPENHIFNEVEIDLKAVEAMIESLKADEIDVTTGIASLEVTGEIQAKKSEWCVNAGELNIYDLKSKETYLECSAGSLYVNMSGKQEDYRLEGDISAASFYFGDSGWDSLSNSLQLGASDAKYYIEAECSAGDMEIQFEE